jgi:ubiquinone/menaquinone biosynthesis C-methylase UbiE
MSAARQTPDTIRSDFDRIAPLARATWDHNTHYHDLLLRELPDHCAKVLEIGCGTGEFTRLLARRAERVVAVDLSSQMIRLACERSRQHPNIEFVCGDVLEYQLPDEEFDCIATLTTLHHLPMEVVLRKIRDALKPGGVFVCLDLYRRSSLIDLLCDGVAYPSSLLLRLLKTGRLRSSRAVREAYAEHGRTDTYLTLPQVERACADALPGARVSRRLLWRYSIVWRKEIAGRMRKFARADTDSETT